MVMKDGLPLLSGDAGFAELSLIPVDNVSQIEVIKVLIGLKLHTNNVFDLEWFFGHVQPIEKDFTLIDISNPFDHLQRRGFACTVWSQDAKHLTKLQQKPHGAAGRDHLAGVQLMAAPDGGFMVASYGSLELRLPTEVVRFR